MPSHSVHFGSAARCALTSDAKVPGATAGRHARPAAARRDRAYAETTCACSMDSSSGGLSSTVPRRSRCSTSLTWMSTCPSRSSAASAMGWSVTSKQAASTGSPCARRSSTAVSRPRPRTDPVTRAKRPVWWNGLDTAPRKLPPATRHLHGNERFSESRVRRRCIPEIKQMTPPGSRVGSRPGSRATAETGARFEEQRADTAPGQCGGGRTMSAAAASADHPQCALEEPRRDHEHTSRPSRNLLTRHLCYR